MPEQPQREGLDTGSHNFSTAFSQIIGDGEPSLIDMVAYCLYKKQKRQFAQKHSLSFDDTRIRHYHDDLNDDRIDTLRVTARSILQDYANTIQEAVRKNEAEAIRTGEIVRSVTDKIEEKHRSLVEQNQNTVGIIKRETAGWKAIGYSIVGGFTLGLIIIAANRMGFMDPFEALPPAHTATNPSVTENAK